MNVKPSPRKIKPGALSNSKKVTEIPEIDGEALHDIRQLTLSNISEEILEISDLVENSMVDLSAEFRKLVSFSQQQVTDVTKACDLLQKATPEHNLDIKPGNNSENGQSTNSIVNEILTESAEVSTYFQKNVNRMIYTMQFQDQARQLMQAISAALNILVKLSESVESQPENNNIKEKVTISEDNKLLLHQMIEEGAHEELDHSYIMKMFLGALEGQKKNDDNGQNADRGNDSTDIEFF